MSQSRSLFRLRKWYLDCVTDDGRAFIAYAGRFRLGPLPLWYHAVLLDDPGEARQDRFSLLPGALPRVSGAQIGWSNRRLRATGVWEGAGNGVRRVLLEEERLRVVWHCRAPACRARVEVGGRKLEGTGYVEELSLSGSPARLPIRELRWGRFAAGGHHLVWIDWQGPRPLGFLLADHQPVSPCRIDDEQVDHPGGSLTLFDRRALREGSVGRTVFGGSGTLAHLIPRGVESWDERKWLSRGLLELADGTRWEGWAIHEHVTLS